MNTLLEFSILHLLVAMSNFIIGGYQIREGKKGSAGIYFAISVVAGFFCIVNAVKYLNA